MSAEAGAFGNANVVVTIMVSYGDVLGSQTPISWSDDYKIGVGQIDGEHEKLFGVYQNFIESTRNGSGAEAIREALIILDDYITYHFTNEEELMISIDFPGLFSHKLEHLDFQVSVARFKKSVLDGEDINQDFVKFFGHWLVAHITIMDRKIGDFLQSSPEA